VLRQSWVDLCCSTVGVIFIYEKDLCVIIWTCVVLLLV
jgi:hypothetical protein